MGYERHHMINCKKIFLLFLTLSTLLRAEFVILDQGYTVISGPIADTMITYSDIFEKAGLDGKLIPLDMQINMEIIRQEAIVDKMPLDDTAADKYIANIQKVHNLSNEDLDNLAAECNRTLPEVKQLLSAQHTYEFVLWHKYKSHLVPTDQQVEDYCKEHPEIEAGYCVIQVAFVDYTQENEQEVRDKIDEIISGKIEESSIMSWSD